MNKNMTYALIFAAGIGVSTIVNNYFVNKKFDAVTKDITAKFDAKADYKYEKGFDYYYAKDDEKFEGYLGGNYINSLVFEGSSEKIEVRTDYGEIYSYYKNEKSDEGHITIESPKGILCVVFNKNQPTYKSYFEGDTDGKTEYSLCGDKMNKNEQEIFNKAMNVIRLCSDYVSFKANNLENKK